MNFSTFTMVGRLVREPEMRATQNGTQICNVGLAVGRKRKDKEETSFFDLVAFGKTAESINHYCVKGQEMLFSGFISQDRWKDKEDQNRQKTKFVILEFQFGAKPKGYEEPVAATQDQGFGDADSDIPF